MEFRSHMIGDPRERAVPLILEERGPPPRFFSVATPEVDVAIFVIVDPIVQNQILITPGERGIGDDLELSTGVVQESAGS